MSKMLNDQTRKKAVGYVRVSKQSDKGVSLEAQAEKIRAMACVHDADVEIVADDGRPASTPIGLACSGCWRWCGGGRFNW